MEGGREGWWGKGRTHRKKRVNCREEAEGGRGRGGGGKAWENENRPWGVGVGGRVENKVLNRVMNV